MFDVFIMGVLATTGVRHIIGHFNDKKEGNKTPVAKQGQNAYLPPTLRQQLLDDARTNFKTILDTSAEELKHSLGDTTIDIENQIEKMANETVQKELEHYQQRLNEMQRNTEDKISATNKALVDQQVEIRAKMQAEVDAEKTKLIAKIDTDLAEAVQSFLLETLQHNIDLGSQTAYLVAKLDEHKKEIIKGLRHEI